MALPKEGAFVVVVVAARTSKRMDMKRDLLAIYRRPLSQKAKVFLADGRSVELSGYVATKSFDRDIDARYLAKTQRISFHCLKDDLIEVDVGDLCVIGDRSGKIVSILDQLDGTAVLELIEGTLVQAHKKEEDPTDGSDDSSRF